MLANENKTVPTIFTQFIATIEKLIEKTCIQDLNRENILPTSTVPPCRALDVNLDAIDFNVVKKETPVRQFAKITPIYEDDTESNNSYNSYTKDKQERKNENKYTMEYCDMV